MSQPLDPLRFPLHGSRLIEASAGTGKTFTLALLYTRLILGQGTDGSAFPRPLNPREILVVTFTDAATQELRDRIRRRLAEAARCFATEPAPAPAPNTAEALTAAAAETAEAAPAECDPLLRDLRDTIPPAQWPSCAQRLRLAAQSMDEAAISTIHGWCYRMLREHAFDTQGLFEQDLVTDQADLLAEVVRDYWRIHVYPLDPTRARCLLQAASDPDALLTLLRPLLGRHQPDVSYLGQPLPPRALVAALDACVQIQSLEESARAQWRSDRTAIEEQLRNLRPHLNGRTYPSTTAAAFETLLQELAAWSEGAPAPDKTGRFASGAFKLNKSWKGADPGVHPAFQAIRDWQDAATDPRRPSLQAALLADAAPWVAEELEQRLLRRAELGFDALLYRLDTALNPDRGARAVQLAATLRRQFPVALIDEFQDTDPLQYRIFDRVYGIGQTAGQPIEPLETTPPATTRAATTRATETRAATAASATTAHATAAGTAPAVAQAEALAVAGEEGPTAVILIGDPKQAIYGFRGADIHVYLAARRATAGRHYALGVNYRSTAGVVDACNQLFAHAEGHARGAFRFRTGGEHPIPFQAVTAHGRPEQLVLAGKAAPPLTLWALQDGDEPIGMGEYLERFAAVAASQIRDWLEQAAARQSGFRAHGQLTPLAARDIAILVRTGKEAQAMRAALTERGIRSVYLSERESIFSTQEAADVLHWLRACADPTNETLVRAALGTNSLAIPLVDLARLQDAELDWEAQIERFRDYRALWQRQGVLPMLRRLLHDHQLPQRLLGRPDGERILTNLLHLAEWLQTEAVALDGEQALLRHLSEHLDTAGDDFILRLESDAGLVKVITIHKSKGLEYPLVLLPFICSWREVTGHQRCVRYRQGETETLEVAGKDRFAVAWEQADDARLSEDMRLLYVALTRARHALWLGIAPLKQGNAKAPQLEKSAIGHLLNGGEPFATPEALWDCLTELTQQQPTLSLIDAPSAGPGRLAPTPAQALDPARPAPTHRPPHWWIASYSALRFAAATAETTERRTPTDTPVETSAQETTLEEATDAAVGGVAATAIPLPPASNRTAPRVMPIHRFPRGSRQGTFLHGILEWSAKQRVQTADGRWVRGFAAVADTDGPGARLRREMLAQRCRLRGLDGWIASLDAWLSDLLTREWRLSDLPDAQGQIPRLRLCALAPAQIQVEMELWLDSRQVDSRALDTLARRYCLPGEPRPALAATQLNGMLKGFIDLVFEHQGRYYIADWKSNHLGNDDSAYSPAAMQHEILAKRYDLQYLLYLLALHRQLAARLPGYDYDRHLGGALYVFLRGSTAASQGLFMDRPPHEAMLALDRLFQGHGLPTEPPNPAAATPTEAA